MEDLKFIRYAVLVIAILVIANLIAVSVGVSRLKASGFDNNNDASKMSLRFVSQRTDPGFNGFVGTPAGPNYWNMEGVDKVDQLLSQAATDTQTSTYIDQLLSRVNGEKSGAYAYPSPEERAKDMVSVKTFGLIQDANGYWLNPMPKAEGFLNVNDMKSKTSSLDLIEGLAGKGY